jgi:O-antigen/teichoic acid export membrane protein
VRRENPGIWSFALFTNLHGTIKRSIGEGDLLIVAVCAGRASAGVYKVVRQLAMITAKALEPLFQVVYPRMARLVSEGAWAKLSRLTLRASAIAATFAVIACLMVILVAPQFVELVVGPGFRDVAPLLAWYTVGLVFAYATVPVAHAMTACGFVGVLLAAGTGLGGAYLLLLWGAVNAHGLLGAVGAFILYHMAYFAVLVLWFRERAAKLTGSKSCRSPTVGG